MDIEGFLNYMAGQTASRETLRAYGQDLQQYEAFLRKKGLRINQAKPSTITDFINYSSANHGRTVAGAHAPATVARRLSVLSAFYE